MKLSYCAILVEEPSAKAFLELIIPVADRFQRNLKIDVEGCEGSSTLMHTFMKLKNQRPLIVLIDQDVFLNKIPDIEEIRKYEHTIVLNPDLEGCYPPWLLSEVINIWWSELREKNPILPNIEFTKELIYSKLREEKRMLVAIQEIGYEQFELQGYEKTGFNLHQDKIQLARRMGIRSAQYGYVPRKIVKTIKLALELALEEAKSQNIPNIDDGWFSVENNVFFKLSKRTLSKVLIKGTIAFELNKRIFGLNISNRRIFEFIRPLEPGIEYEISIGWSHDSSKLLIYQNRTTNESFKGFRVVFLPDNRSEYISQRGLIDGSFATWANKEYVYVFTLSGFKPRLNRVRITDLKRIEYEEINGEWPFWVSGDMVGYVKNKCSVHFFQPSSRESSLVFDHDYSIRSPLLSPSKRYIAFESSPKETDGPCIYLYDRKHQETKCITPFDESSRHPNWISNELIVYSRKRIIDQDDRYSTELWIYDHITGEHLMLTRSKNNPRFPCWCNAEW